MQKILTRLIRLAPWALLVIVICAVVIAYLPPGCQTTNFQPPRPGPPPLPPANPLEPLRSSWDAEAYPDWPVAELLASMSNIVYSAPVDAEDRYRELGFEETKTMVESSMIAYVVSAGDVTVIVFRGTNPYEVSDWVVNLGTLATATVHGGIHAGFESAYQALASQIAKVLDRRKPAHLWVTGHSLGGALALACAYDLVENQRRALDGIVTFGQPMVARASLAAYLDNLLSRRYVHYVNDADYIPRIPPTYAHCGSLVWFKPDGIRRSDPKHLAFTAPGPGETPKVAAVEGDNRGEPAPLTQAEFSRFKADLLAQQKAAPKIRMSPDGRPMYEAAIPLPFLDDHMMDRYLEKIRGMASKPEPTTR